MNEDGNNLRIKTEFHGYGLDNEVQFRVTRRGHLNIHFRSFEHETIQRDEVPRLIEWLRERFEQHPAEAGDDE